MKRTKGAKISELKSLKLTYSKDVTDEMLYHSHSITLGRKGKNYDHRIDYITVAAGFDIETTKVTTETGMQLSFMYIWQLNYNEYMIIGRTWSEFESIIKRIIHVNDLGPKKRMIIWVANLGFEFSFMCKHFSIKHMFAKTSRHPISFLCNDSIEFRDALAITNTSLKKLAEMYTTTQKLDGEDLDYTIIRNSKTPLTPKQLQYCINDSRILGEFAIVIFNTYIIPLRKIPLTASNLLRLKIKQRIKNKQILSYHIASQFPKYDEYELMINYLFRGGVSHSNAPYVDMTITSDNIQIRDFTSSYPAVMLNRYVPVSRFKTVVDDYHQYLSTHCCKLLITFKNITSKTTHSLESKSKIISYSKDAVFDNGRLHSASEILVYINELDYANYVCFYDWKTDECHRCEIATRGYLPEYLTKCIGEDYQLKHDLKEKYHALGIDPDTQPDYILAKRRINTYYGVTVTRMHTIQDMYSNEKGWYTARNFDYNKEVEKAFLLPQWGIWITAWARYNLMQSIYKITTTCGNVVMQYDTDSIILLRNRQTDKFFDAYNAEIYKLNSQMCDRLHLDYDTFYNIGEFDIKCNPTKIKCLGAKRYLYTNEKGQIIPTIAGLPKKAMDNYLLSGGDPYEKFKNKMHFDIESSLKLRVKYYDKPTECTITDSLGNTETMKELSSCSLVETDFTMSLTDEFVEYFELYNERLRRGTI